MIISAIIPHLFTYIYTCLFKPFRFTREYKAFAIDEGEFQRGEEGIKRLAVTKN